MERKEFTIITEIKVPRPKPDKKSVIFLYRKRIYSHCNAISRKHAMQSTACSTLDILKTDYRGTGICERRYVNIVGPD